MSGFVVVDRDCSVFFFFQAEDGIRDYKVTGVQTCALPISCQYSFCAHQRPRFFKICLTLSGLGLTRTPSTGPPSYPANRAPARHIRDEPREMAWRENSRRRDVPCEPSSA